MSINFEKRRSEREPVSMETEVLYKGKQYPAYIENICERGMHIIAATGNRITSFIPEALLQLEIQPERVEAASLDCKIRWIHINKTPIHGLTYRMGVEIINHPPNFNDFFNTLSPNRKNLP